MGVNSKTGNEVFLSSRRRIIRLIALGKHKSQGALNGNHLTGTGILQTPANAWWPPLVSRLQRAVSGSDGWSVLRWGEFRTGSARDALRPQDLQKQDLDSSGQSELTSCERQACLLPWQLMPIIAWTNQTHPSTWTRRRASGVCVCVLNIHMCLRERKTVRGREKGRKTCDVKYIFNYKAALQKIIQMSISFINYETDYIFSCKAQFSSITV